MSDRKRNGSQRVRPLAAVPDGGSAIEDRELMVRTARGDRAAFTVLYDRFAPRVYGLVRRVLRDPAQSEEVAQEVLVEVWRTASRYDPDRASATTWILTIAHRRAIDRVRSVQASRERDHRVATASIDRPHDEVQEIVETRFESAQVREAMTTLTDVQRQAIELAYYSGYTYREVAATLETPLGTIKTRMRDGLIRLRDEMGVTT